MKFCLNPPATTFVLQAETTLAGCDAFGALCRQGDIVYLRDGAEKAVETGL
tara:strand:- start:427 stop:579 length:153 start_codon:yes stop_codon:yes gene_type:complete